MVMRCTASLLSLLLLGVSLHIHVTSARTPPERFDSVQCGSVIKLRHEQSGTLLHSHEVTWGSGSKQQSVTTTASGLKHEGDPNSLWIVRAAGEASVRTCHGTGTVVRCGDSIRLTHAATMRNLHSHHFRSPVSRNQEVSAFGSDGEGDDGDVWVVQCAPRHNGVWRRGASVTLRHTATAAYLRSHASDEFTPANCPNCPIHGQHEVSAVPRAGDPHTVWRVDDYGIYFGGDVRYSTPIHNGA